MNGLKTYGSYFDHHVACKSQLKRQLGLWVEHGRL